MENLIGRNIILSQRLCCAVTKFFQKCIKVVFNMQEGPNNFPCMTWSVLYIQTVSPSKGHILCGTYGCLVQLCGLTIGNITSNQCNYQGISFFSIGCRKNLKMPKGLSESVNQFDVWCLVFNATFSNISSISWRPALVVEEAGVPGENHRPLASNWSTLSFADMSSVNRRTDNTMVKKRDKRTNNDLQNIHIPLKIK